MTFIDVESLLNEFYVTFSFLFKKGDNSPEQSQLSSDQLLTWVSKPGSEFIGFQVMKSPEIAPQYQYIASLILLERSAIPHDAIYNIYDDLASFLIQFIFQHENPQESKLLIEKYIILYLQLSIFGEKPIIDINSLSNDYLKFIFYHTISKILEGEKLCAFFPENYIITKRAEFALQAYQYLQSIEYISDIRWVQIFQFAVINSLLLDVTIFIEDFPTAPYLFIEKATQEPNMQPSLITLLSFILQKFSDEYFELRENPNYLAYFTFILNSCLMLSNAFIQSQIQDMNQVAIHDMMDDTSMTKDIDDTVSPKLFELWTHLKQNVVTDTLLSLSAEGNQVLLKSYLLSFLQTITFLEKYRTEMPLDIFSNISPFLLRANVVITDDFWIEFLQNLYQLLFHFSKNPKARIHVLSQAISELYEINPEMVCAMISQYPFADELYYFLTPISDELPAEILLPRFEALFQAEIRFTTTICSFIQKNYKALPNYIEQFQQRFLQVSADDEIYPSFVNILNNLAVFTPGIFEHLSPSCEYAFHILTHFAFGEFLDDSLKSLIQLFISLSKISNEETRRHYCDAVWAAINAYIQFVSLTITEDYPNDQVRNLFNIFECLKPKECPLIANYEIACELLKVLSQEITKTVTQNPLLCRYLFAIIYKLLSNEWFKFDLASTVIPYNPTQFIEQYKATLTYIQTFIIELAKESLVFPEAYNILILLFSHGIFNQDFPNVFLPIIQNPNDDDLIYAASQCVKALVKSPSETIDAIVPYQVYAIMLSSSHHRNCELVLVITRELLENGKFSLNYSILILRTFILCLIGVYHSDFTEKVLELMHDIIQTLTVEHLNGIFEDLKTKLPPLSEFFDSFHQYLISVVDEDATSLMVYLIKTYTMSIDKEVLLAIRHFINDVPL